jgi:hypothetical protein
LEIDKALSVVLREEYSFTKEPPFPQIDMDNDGAGEGVDR